MDSDSYFVVRGFKQINLFLRVLNELCEEKNNILDDGNVYSVQSLLLMDNDLLPKEMGLKYMGSTVLEGAYCFQIINKKKLLLAKIKYGI